MPLADALRQQFNSQTALTTMGATLERVDPGEVEVRLGRYGHLAQQNGFLHGGMTATLADTACGYAALTLAPAGTNVLTVEFKANFLSPAAGEWFAARGRVKKAGRNIMVCECDVLAYQADGSSKTVAVMLATLMVMPG